MKEIQRKTDKMLEVEKNMGGDIEEILRSKFVDENKSTEEIAKHLNISYVTAFKWLKLAGIYSRRLDIGGS